MRVLLDTNVLARTVLNPDGPAYRVLEACTQPPHVILLSNKLLEEFTRVLGYQRMRARHGLSDDEIDEVAAGLRGTGEVIGTSGAAESVVSVDPDDDHVIATAVAGQADVICTLDRHFRDPAVEAYCMRRGILILGDTELLDVLRQENTSPNE